MTRTAVLEGLGAVVPPRAVSNEDVAGRLDTTAEWIHSRTGISTRYWVDPGTTTGDLAVLAGERALASAGGPSVELVVLATSTGNQPMPATAPEVAHRLGLGTAPAYDVSAACAGFVYALASAAGAISSGVAERVLVIGADVWSHRLNPQDRNTSIIFGDGAGAVVVRAGDATEPGALLGFDLGSDGADWELAVIPGGGSRESASGAAPSEAGGWLAMRGKEMFTQAVHRMTGSSEALLRSIGWEPGDVDRCAAHQANARILNTVADSLGLPRDRMLVHIDRVGNTSAASIPLALTDAVAHGELKPGHRVLLTGFGGGLSWGSTALRWPDLEVRPV